MSVENVLGLAGTLAEAFKDSPELAAYRSAKCAVFGDADLARRLIEYKKAHFEYRLRAMSGIPDAPDFDEEKMLSNAYSDLMLNERAREFLERERAVFDLVNGINEILGEAYGEVDID